MPVLSLIQALVPLPLPPHPNLHPQIQNSSLVQALVGQLEPAGTTATQGDLDRLNLSVAPFLEKNIESLLESVDDLVAEQQKVTTYHKAVARQAQGVASWLQKRRQENQVWGGQNRGEGGEGGRQENQVGGGRTGGRGTDAGRSKPAVHHKMLCVP